jgi:hypothetical protein
MPSQHQLTAPLESDKTVGIAKLWIAGLVVLFLAADEAPDFITLHIGHNYVPTLAL